MRKAVTPNLEWTVETYKIDGRCKDGMKLVSKQDYNDVPYAQLERMYPRRPRYIVIIRETYVTKKNMMTGEAFKERYDTPYFCSPASETFWSM